MASPPVYRLQAVLQLREHEEEAAKRAFADALNHLRQQEQVLQNLEQELERMVEDRKRRRDAYTKKLASGELKVTDQSNASRYIDRLREHEQEQQGLIDGQQENVRNAERGRQRAQENLMEATRNVKTLLKHKEKWQEARKRTRQLKEDDMLDEIAQTVFRKQRGE